MRAWGHGRFCWHFLVSGGGSWEPNWVLPLPLGHLPSCLILYTLSLDLCLAHSFKYHAQVDDRQGGQV